jgi:hypothetical protein
VNNTLYGNTISLPFDIVRLLKSAYEKHKGSSNNNQEGLTRNKGLIDKGTATYQQLGRIKNWFDNYSGPKDAKEYELNGGDKMKKWVNDTLDRMRSGDRTSKEFRKEYLSDKPTANDFKTDISNDNRPSQSHNTGLGKYGIDLSEDLKRINDIIKKVI